VASLEEDKLVVFYYLNSSKIWPDKKGDIWPYMRGTTIYGHVVVGFICYL
jgi:hypothetical protein